MKIVPFYGEGISSNSYLIISDGKAVMIDCAVHIEDVLYMLYEEGVKLEKIILTHGHFDHIETLDEVKEHTGAAVVIHENDAEMLSDGHKNGYSTFFFGDFSPKQFDETVREGDVIKVGEIKLEVIHTPGHSKGSMCLKCGNDLFTGDTLFANNIGRCDLYGGDGQQIMRSLKRLALIDPKTKIYPGHGSTSTIERELVRNYYIRDALQND